MSDIAPMNGFSCVGIIAKREARVQPTIALLRDTLHRLGRKVLGEDEVKNRRELGQHCQLVIVVGGDGTLLSAARDLAGSGVPILGVNQGRLGFMVDVNPDEMQAVMEQILAGDYVREERLLLNARVLREGHGSLGPFLAVNDVVIRNQAAIRMLEFETWLNGDFISQHRADGFIVSSPTGSTAYALSGGGPVLHPGLEALTLVPICPHTLSDRPIVVGADREVRIVLRGGSGIRAMFTCDGQTTETLNPGDAVIVSRAQERLRLIHPRGYNYFEILRSKLHWGRSPAPLRDD